jgi:hypothetical protein|tara:strand:+ start:47 stop:580 length:534 start_codon:yes stop_codon:yes gene_type:complete
MDKIQNILPPEINKHIITKLCNQPNWCFPHDVENKTRKDFFNELVDKNISNAGFSLVTYDRFNDIRIETDLNLYAEIIFYFIKQKLKFNIHTLSRIYWNYYDNASVGNYHLDKNEVNYKSIIYNLHSNDGGTFIQNKFVPSKEGEAIIFSSNIKHKGTPPIKNKHRFNLNMFCLYDT